MIYSTVTYTADGTQEDFLITWNYLDTDHIAVEVEGINTTDNASTHSFTLVDATTLRVTDLSGNPVATGSLVKLKRVTPIDTRAVTFAEGSALRTADLNKNSDYLLYGMQEAIDTIDVAAQTGAAVAQEGAEASRLAAEIAQGITENARDITQGYLSTVQADAATATAKASEASTSETNAATSETNAGASETNASNSATQSANSANASANSATASYDSAASIFNAETNSAASATVAATSATDANTAKTASESARDTAQGYLSTVQADAATATTKASEANTSATNAASSETNAASSASNAATSASNAASSASNAATSASNAFTHETNASTSETNAATSATNANTAKTAAEAALDEFTDLYLGAKASEPTVDNDGGVLQSGAIFYDTAVTNIKVWSGTAWQISYVPASSYLQKTGGALTGPITTTSTFDGRNVSSDGAKLDGIDAGATAYTANQAVNSTSSPTFSTLNASTVDLGAWTVSESSGSLFFAVNGSNKMKLDGSGNVTVTGNVTAYGAV